MFSDFATLFSWDNLYLWKNHLIFWLSFLCLSELLLWYFSRRFSKASPENSLVWLARLLKTMMLLPLFAVPGYLLTLIQRSAPLSNTVRLVYLSLVSLFLYLGMLLTATGILSVFGSSKEDGEESGPLRVEDKLTLPVKGSLPLLALALLCRRIWMFLPQNWKMQGWSRIMVVVTSVLLSLALVLMIQKAFPEVLKRAKKRKQSVFTNLFVAMFRPLQMLAVPLFLLTAEPVLTLSEKGADIMGVISPVFSVAALLWFLYRFCDGVMLRVSSYSEDNTNPLDKTLVEMLRMLLGILFIIIAAITLIRILTGRELKSLLAGLGIGGIAVALAAQDTLKNFFGSIMIMIDKPFKIGERIVTESIDGVVESIGFRSTRIRTLTGNLVIIPNETLARVSVENIGKRASIRRLVNITIPYNTPPEKVERAVELIRNILKDHPGMDPDFPPRVNFNEFTADALNIMVLYWYFPPVYWDYVEFTEQVNLEILRAFNKEGIEFAFPSNTTYLEQGEGKSFRLKLDR